MNLITHLSYLRRLASTNEDTEFWLISLSTMSFPFGLCNSVFDEAGTAVFDAEALGAAGPGG